MAASSLAIAPWERRNPVGVFTGRLSVLALLRPSWRVLGASAPSAIFAAGTVLLDVTVPSRAIITHNQRLYRRSNV